MNSKHSLVFFSGGVILILGLFLIGVIPMNGVLPESQQSQLIEPDSEMELQDNVGNVMQKVEGIIIVSPSQTKPIEQMDCTELNQFILSFEQGWGSTIPMYDEKCS